MLNKISKVKTEDNHNITCDFYSGDVRKYDMSEAITMDIDGFGILKDSKEFNGISVSNNGNSVSWKCGLSLDAMTIFQDGQRVDFYYPKPKYTFARLFSYYRLFNKVTQKKVEELTGITQSDVSKYERGEGNPSLDTLSRLAESVGKAVDIRLIDIPENVIAQDSDEKRTTIFKNASKIGLPSGYNDIQIQDPYDINMLYQYLPAYKVQGQYTIEDLYDIPEVYPVELIRGKIRMMSQPAFVHQHIASYLNVEIGIFIKNNKGKCVVLQNTALHYDTTNEQSCVAPDVLVTCDEEDRFRLGLRQKTDWVIEIVSPGPKNKTHDYVTKTAIYIEAGVSEYWIIDPMTMKLTIYSENDDFMPRISGLNGEMPVGIYKGALAINLDDIANIINNTKE